MNMCYNNYLSLVQISSSDNKPVNQIINQQHWGSSDSQMKDFLSGLACLNQPLHQEGQLSMFTAKTSAEYGRRPVINTWRLFFVSFCFDRLTGLPWGFCDDRKIWHVIFFQSSKISSRSSKP